VPEPPTPPPARVSFPPLAWAGLTLFGLLMLGTLGVQLALIEDQRSTVDRQLRTAVRQANASLPLIEDAQPLVEELRTGAPAVRRLGRDASGLIAETRPLVRELHAARAGEQLQAAGALARTLLDADVPRLTDTVERLADELLQQDRLRRVLVRSASVLGETQALNTVPKLTDAAELAPEQFRVLRESLAVQRETLSITRELLAVARETERHAESLDAKTGGGPLVPPPGG
jgi:hypothetical protein